MNIWTSMGRLKERIKVLYDYLKYSDITIAEKFRAEGAKIGKNCFLQIRKLSSEPYLVEIGNCVSIASGVTFMTHDGASVVFREEYPYLRYFGKIIVEDNCFLGNGAIIMCGIRIGKNSIIGANSVVIADVKEGSIMMGNPAVRISTTEKYKQRCLEEWARQGLNKFNPQFAGKNKIEIQRIMMSPEFREVLKNTLLAGDLPPRAKEDKRTENVKSAQAV
jgi:acetyltransferase-like isoleucine patch superfamily enzyme